jgi:stage V sporulation protein R
MRLKSDLPAALKYQAVVVESAAREAGLEFFDVVFELLDAQDVNGVAAYGGFPVRYPSWRFGMDYERLEKGRRWGLSKIYELVINNDPTYAYLVRSNSLLEQKLVMAHVYGHADFFKNNLWFAPTDRHMLETMSDHGTRVRRYVDALGQDRVERFLDVALSLDTLIDPYLPLRQWSHPEALKPARAPLSERWRRKLESLSALPQEPEPEPARPVSTRKLPTYDVLGFLEHHAPLEEWQRDILHIVRSEAYYLAPQRMTKIANEGWASFWHSRLLTGGLLEPSEIVDFADTHASATVSGAGRVNPYKVGIELFRHAETQGEDLFQLRRTQNDVSLIHKLVDEGFAERELRPVYQPLFEAEHGAGAPVPWEALKSHLLQEISWGGLPQIELAEIDQDGALVLVHKHDGRDLQLSMAKEVLCNLELVWGGPVGLLTIVEKQGVRVVVREGEAVLLETREAQRRCGQEAAEDDPEEQREAG